MALELSEVVGKIGGGVIVDRDVSITAEYEWVTVAEIEITTTSYISAVITHTTPEGGGWGDPSPTTAVIPADGTIVPGVNYARAASSRAQGDVTLPLNTAGRLEPGEYLIRVHSNRPGRSVGLTHVTVTAVPA